MTRLGLTRRFPLLVAAQEREPVRAGDHAKGAVQESFVAELQPAGFGAVADEDFHGMIGRGGGGEFVEARAAVLQPFPGDLLQPLRQGLIQQSHFGTELGEIVLGRSPGRRHADEITLFKSVGVAIQDLCAAARVLANARQFGFGVQLS